LERLIVAIRLRCRRIWVSALLRSLRNQVMPTHIRRHLIVVDQPRDRIVPASSDVSRAA
jgi:hypothetical protein